MLAVVATTITMTITGCNSVEIEIKKSRFGMPGSALFVLFFGRIPSVPFPVFFDMSFNVPKKLGYTTFSLPTLDLF
jgi:hypothetical protein